MMRLSDIGTIRALLARHGFHFSKALGQNFLVNPTVCPRMAEASGAADGVGVLEIGPGIGVLTVELAQRASRVVAVELDSRLLPVLAETLADYPNASVIHGDVMQLDLRQIIETEFAGLREVVVCANLPYYITSPVIMKLLEERLPVTRITVMVQKEAADRICAAPGTRAAGALSLGVSYYTTPEVLFRVNRGSFMPAPNVDSAVIRLNVHPPEVTPHSPERMFAAIRAAFGQRRKTLPNALAAAGWQKPEIAEAMARAGIAPGARGEALTLAQFAALSDALPERNAAKEDEQNAE